MPRRWLLGIGIVLAFAFAAAACRQAPPAEKGYAAETDPVAGQAAPERPYPARRHRRDRHEAAERPRLRDESGFRFVRVRYNSHGRWRPTWSIDWPTAEQNLYRALEMTTGITLEGEPIVLDFTDEAIFEYPILYLCEPGYWETNPEEVASMQKYFARGGFLIIDDFHDYGRGRVGREWENFYRIIKQVFPDREPVELPPTHPIWSIYYDIDPVAAPSTKRQSGEVPWLTSDDDTYYGIFDDNGRMMVLISYNQDLGDGWEWPGGDQLGEASTVSFQMAINIILYALTH